MQIKEQARNYKQEWRIKNKEYDRIWRLKNREKAIELTKTWKKNNKEHVRIYNKNYRIFHKKEIKAWEEKYREQRNKNSLKWQKNNPFYFKVQNQNRRMLTRDLTIKTIQQVYEENIRRYGTLTCYLCLKPVEFGQDSLEHRIPLCKGGTNARKNLDIAHLSCNLQKGKRTVDEYQIAQTEKQGGTNDGANNAD